MQQKQIKILGWTANTTRSKDILQGTRSYFVHPATRNMAPYYAATQEILQNPPISTSITEEEYSSVWKKSREYTSTGQSGIHFGHFIAGCS
jgi:hypothetical protein